MVAIGFYANLIVLILCWLCSSLIIFASKDMLEMVLNSVAVLFMITIDDEIVAFSDYENVLSTIGGFSSKNAAVACVDKFAEILLKIQYVWTKPFICTLILTPLTLIAPLFTIMCYGEDQLDACNQA